MCIRDRYMGQAKKLISEMKNIYPIAVLLVILASSSLAYKTRESNHTDTSIIDFLEVSINISASFSLNYANRTVSKNYTLYNTSNSINASYNSGDTLPNGNSSNFRSFDPTFKRGNRRNFNRTNRISLRGENSENDRRIMNMTLPQINTDYRSSSSLLTKIVTKVLAFILAVFIIFLIKGRKKESQARQIQDSDHPQTSPECPCQCGSLFSWTSPCSLCPSQSISINGTSRQLQCPTECRCRPSTHSHRPRQPISRLLNTCSFSSFAKSNGHIPLRLLHLNGRRFCSRSQIPH
eukprot:TRINITY_DN2809_c0_g4_i1.p1 TRINITY_DN2809_c0_g4~~TRINITY_DN2809_c0_g4_i1.p1  ORF type:complete len:316 (-),score=16.19 TRINITY_DN2809_c0_g4_i1:178-1056(-)